MIINVFIDEAHLFRNARTLRYSKLKQICIGKRVILVTATPLNNSPLDILAQISLFQKPNNSTLPNPKVRNLTRYFHGLQNRLLGVDRQEDKEEYIRIVKENSEEIRENVLQYLMVRRTRSSIEKFYSKDLEEQGLKFVDVNDLKPVYYQFNNDLNAVFNDTLELISKQLKYARYMPLLYLIDEDPEMIAPQQNMGNFMRMLLVKRLESSFYAFKKSVGRFIKSYEQFKKAAENGYVYFSKKDMDKVFEYLENDDEEGLERLLRENKAERKSIDEFKKSLLKDLDDDLKILKDIDLMWKDLDDDPKLTQLINILINDPILKNKLVIFSESKETAEYISNKLNPLFNNKVLYFSGSSDSSLRRVIIDNFDGKARVPKDDYRILVTTDILAEGVNLHQSNVVMNYDIPWNPTKMMQRVGRVQRVGSKFKEVYIYNFFPAEEINEDIGLEEAAEAKINAFIEMLGNDSKLLTDEEIKAHDLFEKLNSKTTFQEDDDEDTELQYLSFLRDIRDNDPELFRRIKRIPKKARTGKESSFEGLITFVRKGKLRKIYLNNGEELQEIDFFKAAELLCCEEDTPRVKLPKEFYDLLEINKKEFDKLFEDEEKAHKLKGRSHEKKLNDTLMAFDKSKFTDVDEQFVKDLQNALLDGMIPSTICKKAYDKMNESDSLDSLVLLNIIRKEIPKEFIYYCPVIGSADTYGQKEVILSEYLKGD